MKDKNLLAKLTENLVYLGQEYSNLGFFFQDYKLVGVEVACANNTTFEFTYYGNGRHVKRLKRNYLDEKINLLIRIKENTLDEVVKTLQSLQSMGEKLAICAIYQDQIEIPSDVKRKIRGTAINYLLSHPLEAYTAAKTIGRKKLQKLIKKRS